MSAKEEGLLMRYEEVRCNAVELLNLSCLSGAWLGKYGGQ